MSAVADLKDLFTRNLRTSGIYIAFVAIVLLFTWLTDGMLLQPTNLTNLVLQFSYVLILALGMIIVIIAGHIDLSVGSVVALTGAVSAVVVIRTVRRGGSVSSPPWPWACWWAPGTASGSRTWASPRSS